MIKCKQDKDSIEPIIPKTSKSDSSKKNLKETRQITPTYKEQNNSNPVSKKDSLPSQSPPKETKSTAILTKEKTKTPDKTKPEITKAKTPRKKRVSRKKPKIQFEELTWDFGEITEGDIIEKKFKFTNIGTAPLEIIATSATCGCTRPSFPFLDIPPGESNVISVNFNSVGKDGEQHPEITIESNAEQKITILKLHGTVVPKSKKTQNSDSTSMSSKGILKDSLKIGH